MNTDARHWKSAFCKMFVSWFLHDRFKDLSRSSVITVQARWSIAYQSKRCAHHISVSQQVTTVSVSRIWIVSCFSIARSSCMCTFSMSRAARHGISARVVCVRVCVKGGAGGRGAGGSSEGAGVRRGSASTGSITGQRWHWLFDLATVWSWRCFVRRITLVKCQQPLQAWQVRLLCQCWLSRGPPAGSPQAGFGVCQGLCVRLAVHTEGGVDERHRGTAGQIRVVRVALCLLVGQGVYSPCAQWVCVCLCAQLLVAVMLHVRLISFF